MRAPGEVVLSDSFRAELARRGDTAMLAFELTDGPLRGQTFWRSADPIGNWAIDGLVPGRYRVVYPDGTDRLCFVESGLQIVLPRAAASGSSRGKRR